MAEECLQYLNQTFQYNLNEVLHLFFAGAEKFGTIMIVSNWANTRIEDIAASAPGSHLWMQTFIFKNRQNNVKLVRRAERLGFKAIVVTIDLPIANVWKHKYSNKLSEEFGKAVM